MISYYKRQYQKDKKIRTQDLQNKLHIESEIDRLTNDLKKINQKLSEDDDNVISSGLQYYTQERRNEIVNKAERLHYSKSELEKVRRYISDDNWNTDAVGIDTILSLESMEQYIGKYGQWWESSLLTKLGQILNQECEE